MNRVTLCAIPLGTVLMTGMATSASASDSLQRSCKITDPAKIIRGVSGYAIANDGSEFCLTCNNYGALGPSFSSSCVHTASGVGVADWEVILLDQAPLTNDSLCPPAMGNNPTYRNYIEYQVKIEHQNDGCVGYCSSPVDTNVFLGNESGAGAFKHWTWTYADGLGYQPLTQTYGHNDWYTFDGRYYSETFTGAAVTRPSGLRNGSNVYPFMRWHEFRRRCCNSLNPLVCASAWF